MPVLLDAPVNGTSVRQVQQDAPVAKTSRRSPTDGPPLRQWIRRHPEHVVDLFVYVVILNLFIEYFPSVISESFTLSLLTAALLKITLELVLNTKSKIVSRMRNATTRGAKSVSALLLWVTAAGSKIVDLVFGDAVSLGGFVSVTLLVITLLVFRAAVRRLLYGASPAPA
jgi:hypothetical protein